eukprot:UN00654
MGVDFLTNLDLNRDVLVEKLAGRRVCPKTGRSYNIFELRRDGYDMDPLLPTKDPTRCDELVVNCWFIDLTINQR